MKNSAATTAEGHAVTSPPVLDPSDSTSSAASPQKSGPQKSGQQTAGQPEVGMDQGLRVLSYLIAGMLAYGGAGWLIDRWLGITLWLPVGIVLGTAFSIFMIIRRYGRTETNHPGAKR